MPLQFHEKTIMLRIINIKTSTLSASIDNNDDRRYFCPKESLLKGIEFTTNPTIQQSTRFNIVTAKK